MKTPKFLSLKSEKARRGLVVALTLALFALCSVLYFFEIGKDSSDDSVKIKISQILSDEYFLTKGYGDDEVLTREYVFLGEILEGERKGSSIKAYFTLDELSQLSSYELKPGDKMLAQIILDENGEEIAYAQDFVRDKGIYLLASIFILSLIAFGGGQGAKTALSLGISCFFIFFLFIPLLIRGYSPVGLSFLTSGVIIFLTLYLVMGRTTKTIASAFGCIGGLGCGFILAFVMQKLLHLTGIVNEESAYLIFNSPNGYLNLKGIVLAQAIIGALGAVMDVSVSVSSSLFELTEKSPKISPRELFKSGINIGRDIMGTMANTLVLAYVGSSLQGLLLIYLSNMGLREAMNREMLGTEILLAVCGSMGLLLTIPMTAFASAFIFKKKKERELLRLCQEDKGE